MVTVITVRSSHGSDSLARFRAPARRWPRWTGSTISIAIGVVMLGLCFVRLEKFVRFDAALAAPRLAQWTRILRIGLPAGGEFALMFVYMAVIYIVIRDFGATAQAGFGIGGRVMQAIFLPAMALAFATSPVAGQNVGAGLFDRVRATFRSSLAIGSVIMLAITLLCQIRPDWFARGFTDDPAVIAVAAEFLRYISWNFVAQGIVFTCSGMFQALGNTVPSLLSALRLLTFALPVVWLSRQAGSVHDVWMASIASATLQALLKPVAVAQTVAQTRAVRGAALHNQTVATKRCPRRTRAAAAHRASPSAHPGPR